MDEEIRRRSQQEKNKPSNVPGLKELLKRKQRLDPGAAKVDGGTRRSLAAPGRGTSPRVGERVMAKEEGNGKSKSLDPHGKEERLLDL